MKNLNYTKELLELWAIKNCYQVRHNNYDNSVLYINNIGFTIRRDGIRFFSNWASIQKRMRIEGIVLKIACPDFFEKLKSYID